MDSKFLVYTALFGNIDAKLHDPHNPALDENVYLCFTDRKDLESKVWKIIYLPPGIILPEWEPRMKARYMKIMLPNLSAVFHVLGLAKSFPKNGDVFLWADSSLLIRCNPYQVAMEHWINQKAPRGPMPDILAFHHPDRIALEDEAIAAHKHRGTDLKKAEDQVSYYRSGGFTEEVQTSLTATGFLFRMQSDLLKRFAQEWWNQIVNFTNRDQISVDYCIWRHHLAVKYLPDSYRTSPLVRFYPHKTERPQHD